MGSVFVHMYMCEFDRVTRRGCGDGTLAARASLKNGFPGLALVTQGQPEVPVHFWTIAYRQAFP